MGYHAITRTVSIASPDGECTIEVIELHKTFVSDRKMMIGFISIYGPYVSGGFPLTPRFLGVFSTVDIMTCEGGKWSMAYIDERLRVYNPDEELTAGDTIWMPPRKFLIFGT